MASASASARSRFANVMKCEVATCCCGCSTRTGLLVWSTLMFINACFGFAGEGALLSGILGSLAQSQGLVAPGVEVEENKALHGALISFGVYTLIASIFGFVAGVRRHYCSAVTVTVMAGLDVVIGILTCVLSWWVSGNFSIFAGQIPGIAVNVYLFAVINGFRAELKRERMGGSVEAPGLPPMNGAGGKFSDTSAAVGMGGMGGAAHDDEITAGDVAIDVGAGGGGRAAGAPGGRRIPAVVIADDDDEDGDLGRGTSAGHAAAGAAGRRV